MENGAQTGRMAAHHGAARKRHTIMLAAILIIAGIGITATIVLFNSKYIEFLTITELPGTTVNISSNARLYNAFPKVIRTSDTSSNPRGALLATWYSGNAHVDTSGDGQIWSAISQDEGSTWTPPFLVHDDPSLDCRNIGIARAPDGTLILFFARVKVDPGKLTWVDFGYITSIDHGHAWQAFVSLISNTSSIVPGAVTGNGYGDPVVIDGTIYIACYGTSSKPAPPDDIAFVLASSDNGTTWHQAGIINAATSITANEADFWFSRNGTSDLIFGFTRTSRAEGDMLHYFESGDDGVTWSSLVATGTWGHSPDIQQLSDGRYIVAYRARTRLGNNHVGYFLLDAGFPWLASKATAITNIHPRCLARTTYNQGGGDMAYPSLALLDGGMLLVVYYDIAAGGILARIVAETSL
jgi:Neuraminidase (sialidase)